MDNLATIKTQKSGMTYQEIRAALMLKGITCKEIASRAGVTKSAVTQTIKDNYKLKSPNVRNVIANALEISVDDIWPPIEAD